MTLTAGMAIERGATLVGVAVVAGVLSLASFADATLRRLRVSPGPRAGG